MKPSNIFVNNYHTKCEEKNLRFLKGKNMQIKTYSNNLRLIVNTKKDVDVISFKLFVQAGSNDEGKNEYGYAHFLEHMFFKSTKNHSGEELLKKLDDLGASKNAYTSITKTCYYFKCLSGVFEKALEYFSEMFFNKTFKSEEIQKEKLVILEEYKMVEDEPIQKCIKLAYNCLFDGTTLGHDVIGTLQSIRSVTANKLLDFKNRLYVPSNIIISISGNITQSQAQRLVEKYFVNKFDKNINIEKHKHLEYKELSPCGKYIATKKENKQTEVYILTDHKNTNRRQRIAYNLFYAILGYGMSSKFFEEIRGKMGLVYSIDAGCSKVANNFLSEILFATSPENVTKALKEIKKIINDCANGNITEEELTRTKNKFISSFVFANESNSVIAENNANDIMDYGKIVDEKEVSKEYMSITLQEIINCAKEVVKENNYVVSAVGTTKKSDLMVY